MSLNLKSEIQKTGSRQGANDLVLKAIASGKLDGATLVSKNVFAKNREEYKKLVAENKVPDCIVKGSRCSNEHYIVKLKSGQTAYLSVVCGDLLRKLADGQTTIEKIEKAAKA